MAKLTLSNVTSLQNEGSAITTLTGNNDTLETVFENTLSRDGTLPNHMEADLDMNSQRVLNLPRAVADTEPVRKAEFNAAVFGEFTYYAEAVKGIVTPFEFGLTEENIALGDSAEPIRLAMEAMNGRGGGTVYLPGGYTYTLRDVPPGGGFIRPLSNVILRGDGDGSIIKVPDNEQGNWVGGWVIIFPQDTTNAYRVDNAQFRDFKIDCNGANNAGFNYTNSAIYIAHGSDIVVDNLNVVNHPGIQVFVFGSNTTTPTIKRLRFTNNRVHNVAYTVNPVGTLIDHSSLYSFATDAIISGNQFINDTNNVNQFLVSTAIEVHGSNATVDNNIVQNYRCGMNIAALDAHCNNVTVTGNVFDGIHGGILWYCDNSFVLDNQVVTGNTFRQFSGSMQPILDTGNLGSMTNDLSGNLLIRSNVFNSYEAAGVSASVNGGVALGPWACTDVSGNMFSNLSGPAITILNTITDTSSYMIKDNTIIDCGRTSTAGYRKGIDLNMVIPEPINQLVVEGNTIRNEFGVYMTTGLDVDFTSTQNGRVHNNYIYNVATPQTISCPGLYPTAWGATTPALPATGVGNAVANNNNYPVMVYMTGPVDVRVVAKGTTIAVGDPTSVQLEPGDSIWFNTTAPSAWKWYGL